MNQGWTARSPEGRRLIRKLVPDGSSDFQRALDFFLESSDSEEENTENIVDGTDTSSNPVDIPVSSALDGSRENFHNGNSCAEAGGHQSWVNGNSIVVVLNGDSGSERACISPSVNNHCSDARKDAVNNEVDSIECPHSPPKTTSTDKSNEHPKGNNHRCYKGEGRGDTKESEAFKLPSIYAHLIPTRSQSPEMGSGSSSPTHRASKEHSNLDSTHHARAYGCTCYEHGNKTLPWAVKTNSQLAAGNNGKQSSKQTTSSSHSKQSKPVVSLLKSRTYSRSLESSPHRLLTRRNYSPNPGLISPPVFDFGHVGGDSSEDGTMRYRSHSWSNNQKPRPGLRGNGPHPSKSQTCDLSPRGQDTTPLLLTDRTRAEVLVADEEGGLGQFYHHADMDDVSVKTLVMGLPHKPGCPLYVSPQSAAGSTSAASTADTTSAAKACESNLELPPLERPRAASESHATRKARAGSVSPRPRLAAARDEACGEPHDHAHDFHVHWADEEQGLSLSTSVVLTRLRPRSYSHGAVDNMPHRPILKKVTGL